MRFIYLCSCRMDEKYKGGNSPRPCDTVMQRNRIVFKPFSGPWKGIVCFAPLFTSNTLTLQVSTRRHAKPTLLLPDTIPQHASQGIIAPAEPATSKPVIFSPGSGVWGSRCIQTFSDLRFSGHIVVEQPRPYILLRRSWGPARRDTSELPDPHRDHAWGLRNQKRKPGSGPELRRD